MVSVIRFFSYLSFLLALTFHSNSAHAATPLEDLAKGVDKMFQSRSPDAQTVYKKCTSDRETRLKNATAWSGKNIPLTAIICAERTNREYWVYQEHYKTTLDSSGRTGYKNPKNVEFSDTAWREAVQAFGLVNDYTDSLSAAASTYFNNCFTSETNFILPASIRDEQYYSNVLHLLLVSGYRCVAEVETSIP